MVMSFFGKGPTGLEQVVARSVGMLGDARHSFDIATLALLTDTDPAAVEADVYKTDNRINEAEQELRSALVVHVAVQGTAEMLAERGVISTMFGEVAELLQEPDEARIDDLSRRGYALIHGHTAKINEYLRSDRPGHEVVPRAIYYRYLKRIVANLLGVVRTGAEPLPTIDYLDGGATDTDD